MFKTAFLFPGQGSQYAGMGKSLAESFPEAAAAFAEADAALGFSISKLCFEGPEEELKRTEITQPALVTVSIAAFRVLQAKGLTPDYVAGHSLGNTRRWLPPDRSTSGMRYAWFTSAAAICRRRCRPAWAQWRRC